MQFGPSFCTSFEPMLLKTLPKSDIIVHDKISPQGPFSGCSGDLIVSHNERLQSKSNRWFCSCSSTGTQMPTSILGDNVSPPNNELSLNGDWNPLYCAEVQCWWFDRGGSSGNWSPRGRVNSREGMIKSLFSWVGFAGGVHYSTIVGFCKWRMGKKAGKQCGNCFSLCCLALCYGSDYCKCSWGSGDCWFVRSKRLNLILVYVLPA